MTGKKRKKRSGYLHEPAALLQLRDFFGSPQKLRPAFEPRQVADEVPGES